MWKSDQYNFYAYKKHTLMERELENTLGDF
jgi:hypothetical protein